MRFDLKLRGHTADGKACYALIVAYAGSQKELKEQADHAARSAACMFVEPPHDSVPDGSQITIVSVGKAYRPKPKPAPKRKRK